MWTHRSPYCPHFTYGPWGRLHKVPRPWASAPPFGNGSLSWTWISIGNNSITGFFFNFQVIISMFWEHRAHLTQNCYEEVGQLEKMFSIIGRLNCWAFQTRWAYGLGFRYVFHKEFLHVGRLFSTIQQTLACNLNLIQPKANLLIVFMFFKWKKLE